MRDVFVKIKKLYVLRIALTSAVFTACVAIGFFTSQYHASKFPHQAAPAAGTSNAKTSTTNMSSVAPSAPSAALATVSADFFSQRVQPIFNNRCVVCHSCNIAPCQLNLTSYEGVSRGATKLLLYDPTRTHSIQPSRFGIDASTSAQWRERGFFTVLPIPGHAHSESILQSMIDLRIKNPDLMPSKKVEESVTCPASFDEVTKLEADRPEVGMPYGLPALTVEESSVVREWLSRGAKGPTQNAVTPVPTELHSMENFLNNRDLKAQVVARYLFEHLFLAHIHVEGANDRRFYRLVRSATKCVDQDNSRADIREIATRRPNSDPGAERFYYCVKPIDQTIVDKNHVVYELSEAKLARWRKIFFSAPWTVAALPSYDPVKSANPFFTFADIPAVARYQWLLDDAQYTVMTFIKGPVCRGPTAVNVINEQFHVFFLDPKADHFVNDRSYAESVSGLLRLPAEVGSDAQVKKASVTYLLQLMKLRNVYRQARDKKFFEDRPHGYSLDDIWDGDQTNSNALLTVLRHYDSAQVLKGALGPIPKTAFVLDYPLFERIIYDLVVGFDVFGNVTHQAATREYMNWIRMEAEENYLNFLPAPVRRPLRDFYYRGLSIKAALDVFPELEMERGPLHETRISYTGKFDDAKNPATWYDAKRQFLYKVTRQRMKPVVSGPVDNLNCCDIIPLSEIAPDIPSVNAFENELRKLTGREAHELAFPKFLDDTMLLRLIVDGRDGDKLYTLVRNREHYNVAWIPAESKRRAKDEDIMLAAHGVVTSYPNRFLVVKLQESADFLRALASMHTSKQHAQFLEKYGISRQNPEFWRHSDWFQERYLQLEPVHSGLLDLTRYEINNEVEDK